MNHALHQLETYYGKKYQGELVQEANQWKIDVIRGGNYVVASILLTPEECGYLTQAMSHSPQLYPLEFFSIALQQGYLNSITNGK